MKDAEQVSMFTLVEEYETEQIPPEQRKEGVKAWTIEAYAMAKGWNTDEIAYWVVRPRRIVFERDSKWDSRYQKWSTFGHVTEGPYWGWYGGHGNMETFRTKPSHGDCFLFVKRKREYRPGQEIRYQGADAAAMARGECDKEIG